MRHFSRDAAAARERRASAIAADDALRDVIQPRAVSSSA
jgi:hypothetical protein